MNNYTAGQEYSGEQIYNYLKAYLLIGNERSKLDTIAQKFLTEVFTSILNSKIIDTNPVASMKEKDSLKILFRYYASFISEQMQNENVYPRHNENALLSIVRMRYQNRPNAESIYARLKENGLSQFPAELTFEQLIEGKSMKVMGTDFKILYIFSADGWKKYIQPAILDRSKNQNSEDWVAGKTQVRQPPQSELDSEKLRRQLTDLYLTDFKQCWVKFLQSLEYSGFESVPYAANNLKLLSDQVASPLVLILNEFANQLKEVANSQTLSDTSMSGQSGLSSLNNADIKRFRKFIVGSDDGSAQPDLNVVIMQYGFLNNSLEQIKGDQELIKNYAVKVMNQQVPEFQTAKNAILGSVSTVQEFQNLLIEPVKLSLKTVFSGTTSYLNEQWKIKVVDVFNKTLANTFPFSEEGNDAPIKDFEDFFKPQDGILWSFFNSELSSFIKKDNDKGLSFSKEFRNSIEKADEISKIFFNNNDMILTFSLEPRQPVKKNVPVKQYHLIIDGDDKIYKMGHTEVSIYSWPAQSGIADASLYITFENSTSNIKSYKGEWAFFKLLNEASSIKQISSSQIILNWKFSEPNSYDVTIEYLLDAKSSKHPFLKDFFSSFKLPDTIN